MSKSSLVGAVCLLASVSIAVCLPALAQTPSQTIFDSQLENGWQSWSWAQTNFANTSPTPSGFSDSIAVTAGPWQALWLHSASDFDSTPYDSITFQISGGAVGGQMLRVEATLGGVGQAAYSLPALPGSNGWLTVTIPLSSLDAEDASNFDGFWIQDATGTTQAEFYVGDVVLVSSSAPPPPVTLQVDATANTHPISPYIYGVAYATTQQLEDLNAPVNRYGGNATSQYNWQLNAANRGSDWYFESIGDSPSTPGGDGDAYVSTAEAAGAQSMITIPTIGWVANLGPNGNKLDSFSVAKYGAQEATDPYWSDAGNGVLSSGADVVNDPNDANIPSTVSFQQGWVQHLISKWGTSHNGGVKFYIMDNEPSLWDSTHRDVHPVGATMAEILQDIESYGSMVKSLDPNALVVGPEEWGWTGYFYSGYDQQYASANGWSGPLPDQTAHGGMYYLPWLLQQLHAYQTQTGVRPLDYFTVHFYPQGGETGGDSTTLDLLRNRSTRQLWDPNYKSESWIGGTSTNNGIVELIPLMKSWVNKYYPGTKIGITEYNWGDEDAMNGATTQADIEGIFGQQGLDLATRWGVPDPAGPTYQAMKMYRNYDGNKSTFGDTSVADIAPDPDNLSSFAAIRSSDGALTILVDNKWLFGANTAVTIDLADFAAGASAHVYQLAAPGTSIVQLPDTAVTGNTIAFSAPPQSVTLFVVPPANSGLSISQIAPSATAAGGLPFKLRITGTGFTAKSTVRWNGVSLTTTRVSAIELTTAIPSTDTATAGTDSITVSNGGSAVSNTELFTVGPPVSVSSLTVGTPGMVGGSTATGTVTLSAAAPAGGQMVTVVSGNTSAVTVPASVTVAYGTLTKGFKITSSPVSSTAIVAVTASANGTSQSTSVTVRSPALKSISLSPSSVTGGSSTTATLALTGTTAAATTITLAGNLSSVLPPSSVVVPAGARSVSVSVATAPVSTSVVAKIKATLAGTTQSAQLMIGS